MSVYRLEAEELGRLIDAVRDAGWNVMGPAVRDHAIMLDPLTDAEDLPSGVTDVQSHGSYRLEASDSTARFNYNTGPQSLKHFLFPPSALVFRTRRELGRMSVENVAEDPAPVAVFGARACDLAAMAIQDQVFRGDAYRDESYAKRRDQLFIVAVNCTSAGQNCFCTSMGTGPEVKEHYDLLLTEISRKDQHFLLIQASGTRGTAVVTPLKLPVASAEDVAAGRAAIGQAAASVEKRMDTLNLKQLLYQSAESPHWDDVAKRCLACANCTMVCPTCFCSTAVDSTDLAGTSAERTRVWDSCFTTEYSNMHGGAVRESIASRYRQWITHKLGSWQDQFGVSGCVGCGRCITWCPAGIDITEEIKGLRVLSSPGA